MIKMTYDPTLFLGTAAYYSSGRPPYSGDLVPTLVAEARLDGSGRLLDVGCGPGSLSLALANHVEDVIGLLARSRFGASRSLFCAGRDDIVQDVDGVLANYFSTSFAAPHLFGDRRARFEKDVHAALTACSPSGLFWDWPGDTQILLAGKTG